MKVSILCTIHRYGGLDMLFESFEKQTFPKSEFEIILCDKLYNKRVAIVKNWAQENGLNVIHFEPKNNSSYHVHSSVLNECLEKATGDCCVIIGDYSYVLPHWIEIHYAYHQAEYCLSAPQKIYGLPKLCNNLEQPFSVFHEKFSTEMFKLLPQFNMDPKIQLPNGSLIDFHYWYNRNESFPTQVGKDIGGWDESYNNRVGPSNLEFGLRLQHEGKCKIACDGRAELYRIMSYPIPPFNEFLCDEIDASINTERYNKLCKKYKVKP